MFCVKKDSLHNLYIYWRCPLTRISLASYFWDIGKQYRPRWDAASHLSLHYLLTGISIKNENDSLKIESGLVQMIMMGKSIRQMWVKYNNRGPNEIMSIASVFVFCDWGSLLLLLFFLLLKQSFFFPIYLSEVKEEFPWILVMKN